MSDKINTLDALISQMDSLTTQLRESVRQQILAHDAIKALTSAVEILEKQNVTNVNELIDLRCCVRETQAALEKARPVLTQAEAKMLARPLAKLPSLVKK